MPLICAEHSFVIITRLYNKHKINKVYALLTVVTLCYSASLRALDTYYGYSFVSFSAEEGRFSFAQVHFLSFFWLHVQVELGSPGKILWWWYQHPLLGHIWGTWGIWLAPINSWRGSATAA